jgi:hypothetical protein
MKFNLTDKYERDLKKVRRFELDFLLWRAHRPCVHVWNGIPREEKEYSCR